MQKQIDELRGEVRHGFKTVDERLTKLEALTRKTASVVAGHTEAFFRVEARLDKLDQIFPALARLQATMDALAGEVVNSRAERVLSDKSFRDQQSMLLDHEVRLHRLERRPKPS